MPFIKSLIFKCCAYVVAVILLLSKIMPICSCYIKKKLIYIAIADLFNCQTSFCIKYTKLNICSFCNI